jgi:hypothetical protein
MTPLCIRTGRAAVAAVALGLAACGTTGGTSPVTPATLQPHTASTTTPAAPAITAAQERFIDAMRNKFPTAAKGSTSEMLATFQGQTCEYLISGMTEPSAEQQAQGAWAANWVSSPPPSATIAKIVTLAAQDGCKASLTAALRLAVKQARAARREARQDAAQAAVARREARQDAAQAAAARRLAHSVTYIVSGSPANVTYGPAGSDYQGTVPMDLSAHLGNPVYYAITAQLQGGGAVSCAIKVAGKVISRATATGGYNIATCEIVQNPLYGGWESANG